MHFVSVIHRKKRIFLSNVYLAVNATGAVIKVHGECNVGIYFSEDAGTAPGASSDFFNIKTKHF